MGTTRWGRFGVVAAAAGVAGLTGTALVATSVPASAAAGLHGFDDCEELREWYAQAAVDRLTVWGAGTGTSITPGIAGAPGAETVADAAAGSSESAGAGRLGGPVGNGSTGTNVQEAGVDEPDIAKTDGRNVVVVRDDTLRVFDATGDEPRRLGEVTVPDATFDELLLVGEYAVLLGRGDTPASVDPAYPGLAEPAQPSTRTEPSAPQPDLPPPPRPDLPTVRTPHAVVTTVDLSTATHPRVVNTDEVDGTVVSAREYDGVVRVVLSSTPDLPGLTPERGASEDDVLASRRAAIRAATAEDWLPSIDGQPLLDCSDVRHPEKPSGLGTLSVLTFAPDRPQSMDAVGVAADGDLVYSSTDRLYVATTRGGWTMPTADGAWRTEEGPRTQVHSFVLDDRRTTYAASGTVRGTVHSRWAFSEHEGRLRVATILSGPQGPTENAVSVLEERGDELQVVGSVAGLGVTEQIRSVRWFGDLAVVVTFRQTDPLYTVDLSDPERPLVRGELKIPGYSAYLHPVGDDLLLGVGQDATSEGIETGAQVSTFDLTDLEDPRPVATHRLGHRTYTPVEEDSRAFTFLPERGIALVPVLGATHEMHLVRLGERGDLAEAARIALPGLHEGEIRALPLDDGRVALASGAELWRIVAI